VGSRLTAWRELILWKEKLIFPQSDSERGTFHGSSDRQPLDTKHRKFLSWSDEVEGIPHRLRDRDLDGDGPESEPLRPPGRDHDLIAYRHGLRASEVCDLQWHQVELTSGRLHVRRSKRGTPSVHPMQGDEIRALRRLQREQEPSSHVFTSERGGPMTPKSFHTLIQRVGERAGMPFPIHPHMLRHACGFALANAGHETRALQAWLGHRNIQHTVRYTELSPDRFRDFWRR
jgi:integrase